MDTRESVQYEMMNGIHSVALSGYKGCALFKGVCDWSKDNVGTWEKITCGGNVTVKKAIVIVERW